MVNFNPSRYLSGTHSSPACIDLFCGAGGLSLGFSQAGGVPVAAVDNDPASMETYQSMFPMCRETYVGDIESWYPRADLHSVDVMIGGPPCQGFSLARGFRFVDDPRNHLYKQFVRLVEQFRPSWIVMENVQGITNIGKGVILKQIYEDFEKIGYWLSHKVINMADYGVPQTRKRAIFVGSRTSTTFTWPEPTHVPLNGKPRTLFDERDYYVSVKQALEDLPWPMGQYFAHRANSQMRGPRNRNVDTDPAFTLRVRGDEFALCEEPATGAFVPGPLPDVDFVYRPATTPFQEAVRESPPTWIGEVKSFLVDDRPPSRLIGSRRLSIREQARLQTFPDWFEFKGRPYAQGRQIGNAVPPLFAKRLFESIFEHLNDHETIQNQRSRPVQLTLGTSSSPVTRSTTAFGQAKDVRSFPVTKIIEGEANNES
jgi:DNA (cytosine-5)-methyltransferase 1